MNDGARIGLVRLVASIAAGACLVAPAAVEAERSQRPGAQEMLEAAELIQQERCDLAIPLLRRAFEIGDLRNALWNLAECYALMGHPRQAIEAYRQYSAHPRTGPDDRAAAEAAIARVEATLCRIDVGASVDGARVRVDGEPEGETPVTVAVGPGPHVVEVSSPGFAAWTQRIEVGGGETRVVRAALDLLPGTLGVRTAPPGAEVSIDGELLEQRTPIEGLELPAGAHIVELRADGRRPVARRVALASGQRATIELGLEPLEGTLVIGTNAPGAVLRIDGADQGRGPFAPIALPPGRYALDVRAEDHGPWSGDVEVRDQHTTRVSLELQSTQGLHRGWFWGMVALSAASFVTALGLVGASLHYEADYVTQAEFIETTVTDPFGLEAARADGLDMLVLSEDLGIAGSVVAATCLLSGLAAVLMAFRTHFRDRPARADVALDAEPDGAAAPAAGGAR
jgi:hypothetical protein